MRTIFGSESRFAQLGALAMMAPIVVMGVVVGCARDASPTEPTSPPADTRNATLVAGDIAPIALHKLPAAPGAERAFATMSAPGTPKVAIKPLPAREVVKVKETMIFVAPGTTEVDVPVDESDGASVYLTPQKVEPTPHVMKEVAFFSPSGVKVNVRAPRHLEVATPGVAPGTLKAAGKDEVESPLPVVHLRHSKDPKGTYQVKLGPNASKGGLIVEARFPSSSIEMDLAPCAPTVLAGDKAMVSVDVLDGATGIADATIEAELVAPDHVTRIPAPVKVLGGGKFAVAVAEALTESSEPGQYTVYVRAKGSAGARKFDRFGMTGFSFAVPTARLATVSAPRSIVDGAGKITGFDVDVALEVASFDRYEVSAVLAHQDPDGTERPVALAQSAAGYDEGTHTLTLHFDAGHVRLTGYEGAFVLRSLALFSQGRNALYHRLGRGLELHTAAVKVPELAPLAKMTPAVQQMIADGEFELTKP